MTILRDFCRYAKAYALETNFATTVVSTLDDRVSQLSLQTLAAKTQKRKTKGQLLPTEQCPAEAEIMRLMSIIKNLLVDADENFKDAVVTSGLPDVLFRLLSKSEARENSNIVRVSNQVLVNMTTRSASGQCSMVRVGGSSAVAQGVTLLHRVMKMVQRSHPSAESLLDCMSIMGNCASSTDCMHLIMKSTIVDRTVELLSAAADCKDAARAHAALVFLLRLSVVEEGRSIILKVVGAVSTIARVRQVFFLLGHIRYHCSLVYRNLAYSSEAKVHFMAQDGAFAAIMDDLDGEITVAEADHCRAHAANAIWALIYNCQKVSSGESTFVHLTHHLLGPCSLADPGVHSQENHTRSPQRCATETSDW